MSADNEVAITRWKNGSKFEYRVAHIQASENLFCGEKEDAYRFLLFKDSRVFTRKCEAEREAEKIFQDIMDDDFGICEYGITFYKFDVEFPHMTIKQANKIIDF